MTIGGSDVRLNINSTTPRKILEENPNREGYTLLSDPTNTAGDNIFVGFGRPPATTGDAAGIRLQPGEQISESPPKAYTKEIWVVSNNTNNKGLFVREDT